MANGDFKFSVSEADYVRIQRALEEMSEIEKDAVVKSGLKQGGDILLVAGKASFLEKNKKKTGNLYRAFTKNLKTKKKNTSGILVGFKRGKGKGNHSHLIDKGTTHRFTKKGYYRGKIDSAGIGSRGRQKTGKTYFWSSVANAKGQEAMDRVTKAIYRAIEAITGR